jgi:hypothetical protein
MKDFGSLPPLPAPWRPLSVGRNKQNRQTKTLDRPGGQAVTLILAFVSCQRQNRVGVDAGEVNRIRDDGLSQMKRNSERHYAPFTGAPPRYNALASSNIRFEPSSRLISQAATNSESCSKFVALTIGAVTVGRDNSQAIAI